MTPLGRIRLRSVLAEARSCSEDRADVEDTEVTNIIESFALEIKSLEKGMGMALVSQDALLWGLANRFAGGRRMPMVVGDNQLKECKCSAGSAAIRSY